MAGECTCSSGVLGFPVHRPGCPAAEPEETCRSGCGRVLAPEEETTGVCRYCCRYCSASADSGARPSTECPHVSSTYEGPDHEVCTECGGALEDDGARPSTVKTVCPECDGAGCISVLTGYWNGWRNEYEGESVTCYYCDGEGWV